jgi:hypothetical protein
MKYHFLIAVLIFVNNLASCMSGPDYYQMGGKMFNPEKIKYILDCHPLNLSLQPCFQGLFFESLEEKKMVW